MVDAELKSAIANKKFKIAQYGTEMAELKCAVRQDATYRSKQNSKHMQTVAYTVIR